MANVYLAEDQELGRRVAIKILNDRHAGDEQFVERFRREAKNAAGLSHPNIVSIYDRGEAEGTYYIAMEYLDGRSLKELIVARGPAPVASRSTTRARSSRRCASRTGTGSSTATSSRTTCSSTREGRLKVTDFGIARAGREPDDRGGLDHRHGAVPLARAGARRAGRPDLRSLLASAIVLYELLTGDVPFTGDTPVEIAMKHLSRDARAAVGEAAEVPHDLDTVVLRALAKDPHDRYQSAEEMDADLARVAAAARGLATRRRKRRRGALAAPPQRPRRPTVTRRRATPRRPHATAGARTTTTTSRAAGRSGRGSSRWLLVVGARRRRLLRLRADPGRS